MNNVFPGNTSSSKDFPFSKELVEEETKFNFNLLVQKYPDPILRQKLYLSIG